MHRSRPPDTFGHRRASVLCCLLLAGCVSPDPPLLATELPNGYSFRSNGGSYGYIRKTPGMLSAFGRQDDGSERWCEEFGWQGDLVVCRMSDQSTPQQIRALGYFILDTRSGRGWLAADLPSAQRDLRAHGVAQWPTLATRFWSTRAR
ncbi:hypothetical protein [Aquimonas sp.]|jgi:hypothetical protein|uniref:hypothetical protein n=1 Tax=Aquimonas sp. TaxID=1872588 RepID=UPI0037BF5690